MELPVAEKRRIYIRDNNGNYVDTDKYIAVVNPVNDYIFGIMSNRYSIFQHKDIFPIAHNILGDNFKIRKQYLTRNGARFYVEYVSDEVLSIDGVDNFSPMIIAMNSYDGSLGLSFDYGYYRIVCDNGARIGEKILQICVKHIGEINSRITENFIATIEISKKRLLDIFSYLYANIITKDEAIFIAEKIFPKKYAREVVEQMSDVKDKLSMWELYNMMTYVTTHIVKSYETRRLLELKIAKEILVKK